MKNIIKTAAINAGATILYIVIVATFLTNASHIFGPEEPKTVLVPILMLSLLVFSAAVTGSLVFGRPILWYLDGNKKEALQLLLYTLGIFFGIMVVCAFALLTIS
jgi:hypothetical protein